MAHAKHEEGNKGELDPCSHFLIVAYGIQGHLNPARTLARRLARIGGCKATLSIQLCGYRRMFPSLKNSSEISDGVISYIPFSDGKDDGSWPKDTEQRIQSHKATFKSLSAIVNDFASRGRPITSMMCTISMPVVFEVAREHKIPLAVYWIQPATTLATYYHYFHGYDELIHAHSTEPTYEVSFPGLYPLKICDMPTFFTETTPNELSITIMQALQELFQQIDQERPMVLVNTFTALESIALEAIKPYMDIIDVGPAVPPLGALHGQQQDEKDYMEWLDMQLENSVVYLSFGSMITYTKRQLEEILEGLGECGRPYLWMVRKEGCMEVVDFDLQVVEGGKGMVVEWCDQLQVLFHPSLGCFVTHCGWNSTLEAIVAGVPMVAVPSWSDQPLNAHLVEKEWSVGVRAVRDAEGVLTQKELVRCVELVMGDSEKAMKVKEKANNLKTKAHDVLVTSGPLEISLRGFINRIQDQKGHVSI
ncbi:hypothetical protein PR202_gb16449 [Eleusine coracana subsp. coracana]|uniref:Glycosyltransferase n=1 Tax=Eleusine coracana subsp. coracana TaxID=191504 RepID=A0AAV5F0D1_ELECO|nr:hypothetical protein PR202_gb16449 [Eleusine coracana subsp. coracana]